MNVGKPIRYMPKHSHVHDTAKASSSIWLYLHSAKKVTLHFYNLIYVTHFVRYVEDIYMYVWNSPQGAICVKMSKVAAHA